MDDRNPIAALLHDLEQPAPTLPEAVGDAPPKDNAPKRRGLRPTPLDAKPRQTCTLHEGRQMIEQAIGAYLSDPMPGHMLLIAAPAGIGKTTIAVKAAEWRVLSGLAHRVMYAGPRKDFFSDVRAASDRAGLLAPAYFDNYWYAWKPRMGGDAGGLGATCRWSSQIDLWQKRGYEARAFCSNPRICGWNYIHESCRYYAQEQQKQPIIFAQYEHVALGHLLMDKVNLLIGDELPIRAFLNPWLIPSSFIVPNKIEPGPVRKLFETLATLATIKNTGWFGADLVQALGGATYVRDLCEEYQMDPSFGAYEPELRSADDVDTTPYFHLPYTLNLLGREAKRMSEGLETIHRVRVTSSGLTLLLRRTPHTLPDHIIWLDATANTKLYETLFDRPVTVIKPDVDLKGHVYQVWDGLNNKMRLNREGMKAGAKIEHLRQQITRILERGYHCPAFISYKDLVKELLPSEVETDALMHFGGNRGTNRFQDCDCLIVVGAPQPPFSDLVDMAAMLYHERDESFDTTWDTMDRPFTGQPWSWPIGGFWNDPQLQTLLEQSRESELIQAIHRARPLIRDVDIWLLTNVPLEDIPVDLITLRELFGDVPAGIDMYRWPEVLRVAEERFARVGRVTTADLVDQLDITRATAIKCFDALLTRGWCEIDRVAGEGRGPRMRACVKDYQENN